jgi:hypothetical protein
MAKGQKEAMQAEWVADLTDLCCRWQAFSGEHVNADIYQELLRQHVDPWVQTTFPGKNSSFGRFSIGLHC